MSRSQRLRFKDVRAAYRLLGECRELGADPLAWRRHMLDGLRQLVGARVGLYLHVHGVLSDDERLSVPLDTGFLDPSQRTLWARYQQQNAHRDDPFHRNYYGSFTGRLRTRSLASVVEPELWYRSTHYHDYVRACDLDDRITSSLRLSPEPDAPVQVIVLHREAADSRFPRSAVRLVHLFHHELGTMLGGPLTLPDAVEDPHALPPRLRQVLACLLRGDSEKLVAQRLGISRHTVSRHVQRLHRRFGVQSRGELLHRCRDMLPLLNDEDPGS